MCLKVVASSLSTRRQTDAQTHLADRGKLDPCSCYDHIIFKSSSPVTALLVFCNKRWKLFC